MYVLQLKFFLNFFFLFFQKIFHKSSFIATRAFKDLKVFNDFGE